MPNKKRFVICIKNRGYAASLEVRKLYVTIPDSQLAKRGLDPKCIRGYEHEVKTHTEAAALIEARKADAALGLQAAADQHGLNFIPLFEERYDLVLLRENEAALAPLLDYLQTAKFRQELNSLGGYDTAHSGEQIPL